MPKYPQRLSWLHAFIAGLSNRCPEGFTGSIRINFMRGGITGVNVEESIRGGDFE